MLVTAELKVAVAPRGVGLGLAEQVTPVGASKTVTGQSADALPAMFVTVTVAVLTPNVVYGSDKQVDDAPVQSLVQE